MEAKVHQLKLKNNIPAGLIEKGTEGFWHAARKEKWVIHQGTAMRYMDAPIHVQSMFITAYLNDKKSQTYLRKHTAIPPSEWFDWWYRCVIGGLDHIPDFIDGKLIPDGYNNTCTEDDCRHRGKFCSRKHGLKNEDVKTIRVLKEGKTIEEAAPILFLSEAGLKSRVEKIKEKLDARNMASLMARATEIGI